MKKITTILLSLIFAFVSIEAQQQQPTIPSVVWNKKIANSDCIPKYDTLLLSGDVIMESGDGGFAFGSAQLGGLGFTVTKTTGTGEYVWNNLVINSRGKNSDSGFLFMNLFEQKDSIFAGGCANPGYLWGPFNKLFQTKLLNPSGIKVGQNLYDSSYSNQRVTFFNASRMMEFDSGRYGVLGSDTKNSKSVDFVCVGKVGQKPDWASYISNDLDNMRRPVRLTRVKIANQDLLCLVGHNNLQPNTIYLDFLSNDGNLINNEIRLARKVTEIPLTAYSDNDRIVILTNKVNTDNTVNCRILEVGFDGTILAERDINTLNGINGTPIKTSNGGWLAQFANYINSDRYDGWFKIERDGNVSSQYLWSAPESDFRLVSVIECENGDILACGFRNNHTILDITRFKVQTSAVDENNKDQDVLVIPNPCSDILEVHLPAELTQYDAENFAIIDILGLPAVQISGKVDFLEKNIIRVNTQNLSSGVYFIKLSSKIKPLRFVKF